MSTRARLDSLFRTLADDGDMTPTAVRQIERVLNAEEQKPTLRDMVQQGERDGLYRNEEASVQPPTREQIAEALWKLDMGLPWTTNPQWQAQYLERADAVLALFPQPTLSAECTCGYGGVHEPMNPRCERNGYRWTTQPSIADMVPGTTLWARFVDEDHDRFLVIVNDPEWPVLDPIACDQWQYSHIDPSTIRDVTPPSQ